GAPSSRLRRSSGNSVAAVRELAGSAGGPEVNRTGVWPVSVGVNAPQGGRPSRRTVLLAATAAIAGGSGVAAAAVGLSRALNPGPAAGTGSQGGGSTAPASPASPVRASPAGGPRASDWA